MKIKNLLTLLIFSIIISVCFTFLGIIFEIPNLLLLKFGVFQNNPMELLSKVVSFDFSFGIYEIMFYSFSFIIKILALFSIFKMITILLKDLLIPYYYKIYLLFIGLLIFFPSVMIYFWLIFLNINIMFSICLIISISSTLIVLFSIVFKEISSVINLNDENNDLYS